MIRCNLSILLAERNLKITQVSKDTGISRTTLTSLSNNYSQGIQFDTVNTLCNYLKITPEQLISYIPIDISIIKVYTNTLPKYCASSDNEISLIFDLKISEKNKSHYCKIPVMCYLDFNSNNKVDYIDIILKLFTADDDPQKDNSILVNILKKLPIPFLNGFELEIKSYVISWVKTESELAKYVAVSFNWNNIFDY